MPRTSQELRPQTDQGSAGTPPFKKPRLQTCRQSPGIVTKVCMPARGRVCTIELMCAAARRLMPSHRASRLWKQLIDRLPAQLTPLPQEPPAIPVDSPRIQVERPTTKKPSRSMSSGRETEQKQVFCPSSLLKRLSCRSRSYKKFAAGCCTGPTG